MTFLLARFLVCVFFCADLIQVLVQHVHVARIEVEPLVERDFDVDRGDIVLLHRRRRRTLAAIRHGHWFDPRIGHEQHVLSACAILVHHGGGVVHPGIHTLHLRILRHVLHDALMLLFDHRSTVALAGHRVLDDGLPLELFGPSGKLMILMIHRHVR